MLADEIKALAAEQRRKFPAEFVTVSVCGAAGCQALSSEQLHSALASAAAAQGHGPDRCRVRQVGCLGLCGAGPLVTVEPGGIMYQKVQVQDAGEIAASLHDGPAVERIRLDPQLHFFHRQQKIVLENSGRIDPDRLEDYIAADGYLALSTALSEMTPAGVIFLMELSPWLLT